MLPLADLAALSVPVVGALGAWGAVRMALRCIFHPRAPALGFQGLLPRRRLELCAAIATQIAARVRPSDLLKGFEDIDLTPHLAALVEQAINAKLEDVRRLPLIGSLVTPERLAGISAAVVKQLVLAQPAAMSTVKTLLDERIDVATEVRTRLEAIDLVELERELHARFRAELRLAARVAAAFGFALGVLQVAVQAGLAAALAH
jgi:uncharacterized membrane protein YheB (UPF0754 family)